MKRSTQDNFSPRELAYATAVEALLSELRTVPFDDEFTAAYRRDFNKQLRKLTVKLGDAARLDFTLPEDK